MRSCCCAWATSGQAVADPTIAWMKSRRRIAFPEAQDSVTIQLQQGIAAGGMGFNGQFALQKS
jgi:hypothetical protein